MATPIPEVLITLTSNVSKISSKDDFERILKRFDFYKINFLKKDNFFDFPQSSPPKERSNNLSYTYLYEIFPEESITSPIIKVMYLDSINGTLIVMDIFNERILEQLRAKVDSLETFIFNPNSGAFMERHSTNFIYFTFYPSINLFATLISSNEDLFKHPIYSYNKVLDFLS